MALGAVKYNKLEAAWPGRNSAGLSADRRIADPSGDGYNKAMASSSPIAAPDGGLSFRLADLAATADLAGALAGRARAGDVIALHGPLGAGKTAFARAFITARAALAEQTDALGDVPSPTFTLVQTYDMTDPAIWHFDLYRLDKPDDALELGLDEAFADAISLIEWPERLGPYLPRRALHLSLDFDGPGSEEGARIARLTGAGDWPVRLEKLA
jgi:tRNA threonylcarbamoyladenosine biosynthesis protein TsaE